MAAALRAFGAMLIFIALLAFDSSPARAQPLGLAEVATDYGDGGACGEDEEFEELIDCGSDLEAHFDEPFAIAILRTTVVRTTKQQCAELLADIWERQACAADNRECGTMIPAGMPGPGPKLASSSGSANSSFTALGLPDAGVRRLGPPIDERMPKLRELSPPIPPPKLG